MTQQNVSFNVYYDDDIENVIDKFCRAPETFVNIDIEYDDDGIAEITLSSKENNKYKFYAATNAAENILKDDK